MKNLSLISLSIFCVCTYADFTSFEITSGLYTDHSAPAIDGDNVVWRDPHTDSIYVYNLKTHRKSQIITEGTPWEDVRISGNIVVWAERVTDETDIYGYNLSTEIKFEICTEPGRQIKPSISDNIIVWQDYRNWNGQGDWTTDIYGYNLNTGNEFIISLNEGKQLYPKVKGNIVVWQNQIQNDPDSADIYAYDLNTCTEFAICTAERGQFMPSVSDNYIVWHDWRSSSINPYNSGDALYVHDLSSGQEFELYSNWGDDQYTNIDGDIIVWQNSSYNSILGYNMLTDTFLEICTESNGYYPDISGNTVVWVQYLGDGEYGIYGSYIPEPCSLVLIGLGGLVIRKW